MNGGRDWREVYRSAMDRLFGLPAKTFESTRPVREVVEQADALPPAEALAVSYAHLLHREPDVRMVASQVFERALERLGDTDLSELDHLDILEWPEDRISRWGFTIKDLEKYEVIRERSFFLLATRFPDGYVREYALRALIPTESLDWPFVLERVSDWVPNVRRLAWAMVRTGLESGRTTVDDIMGCQKMLAMLAGKTRVDTEPLIREILAKSLLHGSLIDDWNETILVLRRLATPMALANPARAHQILPLLYAESDPAIVGILIDSFEEHPEYLQPEACQALLRHRNPRIRATALDAVFDFGIADVEKAIVGSLADPIPRVRSKAQFLASKIGFSARDVYLEALESPGAIQGLAEVGTVADAPLIEPFMQSPHAKMRLAAARGLLRLGADGQLGVMLRDSSSRVRRVAFEYALQHYEAFETDAREALYKEGSMAGAELLMALSRWSALPWILRFVGSDNAGLQARALKALRRWLALNPYLPSREALQEAASALAEARPHIPAYHLPKLESVLQWAESTMG